MDVPNKKKLSVKDMVSHYQSSIVDKFDQLKKESKPNKNKSSRVSHVSKEEGGNIKSPKGQTFRKEVFKKEVKKILGILIKRNASKEMLWVCNQKLQLIYQPLYLQKKIDSWLEQLYYQTRLNID